MTKPYILAAHDTLVRRGRSGAFGCFILSAITAMPVTAQDLPSFAIVAGQELTNTGATTIGGNIAVSPGTSYTGRGTVTQDGAIYLGDATSVRIQNDLTTLYAFLAARPTSSGGDLTGQDLDGLTLAPGVYSFASSAHLSTNGRLTLDAGGNENAVFILNIGSTLIADSHSRIVLANGAQGGNVFFRVGSSATLGDSVEIEGQIVALTSITMNAAAKITCGAAFARNGAVTMIANTIQICTFASGELDAIIADPAVPPSQQAILRSLSEFRANGGVLPVNIGLVLATQTPAELAVSLAQLSGEVATGLAPMGLQGMDSFLDTVMGRGYRPDRQLIAPRDAGVPAGMVPDKINAPYLSGKGSAAVETTATPPLAFSAILAEQPQPWNVWASAYGSRNVTDGDAGNGVSERTSDTRGIAAGVNYAIRDGLDLGVALSWNTANFMLDDGSSSGTGEAVFVALRGRSSNVNGYVAGALAYGRHDLTTDRSVTIAGFDRLGGQTKADHVAAHVEAGYHLGIFTPFAGLRAQSFNTDAYTETATAGVDTYALGYAAQRTNSLRSELGVDMRVDLNQAGAWPTAIGLRAAWAHELIDQDTVTGHLATTPNLDFHATGASQQSDSLILDASIGTAATNGIFLEGGVNVEYAADAKAYGGAITVGYRW